MTLSVTRTSINCILAIELSPSDWTDDDNDDDDPGTNDMIGGDNNTEEG